MQETPFCSPYDSLQATTLQKPKNINQTCLLYYKYKGTLK